MALPALRALRCGLPEARIVVVGRWAGLLAGQGVADVLLGHPPGLGDRLRLARHLRASRPDVAVVLPNSFESALAARAWGAAVRIGFAADARDGLLTARVPLPAPRAHQVDEYAMLVAALGLAVAERVPRWERGTAPDAQGEVQGLLAAAGCGPGGRLVGLHVGSALGGAKLWPAASFARLAVALRRTGLVPLLLGAPGDAGTAAAVGRAAGTPVASLVGRDRPALLPAVLTRIGCLVSGDTGVAHLAAALGVPTVTLFGPTDPARSAPRGAAARVVVGAAPCAPCFLTRCPIDHECLRAVSVAAVARQVAEAAR